jgi:hypothetical protein
MNLINRTGMTKLDDLRPVFASDAEHPHVRDQLKQTAFYTDSLRKAHWSIPTNAVDRDLAERIITIAQMLSKASRPVTPRELKLWKQHMSHVADGLDMEASRTALSEWYAAMQAEGLRPPGPNGMQTFVTTGLDVMPNKGR